MLYKSENRSKFERIKNDTRRNKENIIKKIQI